MRNLIIKWVKYRLLIKCFVWKLVCRKCIAPPMHSCRCSSVEKLHWSQSKSWFPVEKRQNVLFWAPSTYYHQRPLICQCVKICFKLPTFFSAKWDFQRFKRSDLPLLRSKKIPRTLPHRALGSGVSEHQGKVGRVTQL